jgi:tRNA(Ile)-lysidine synthase TilS/MesJ
VFLEKYEKFKKTITDFNIIPNETKKIVIGMSGGKDCAIMTHFLMEYQKQERPDIKLEMIFAPVPHPFWEEIPDRVFNTPLDNRQKELIINQKKLIDSFNVYWSRYLEFKSIPIRQELFEDRILKMYNPCSLCFHYKMKAYNDYFLKQQYEDNTLFSCGLTKWDSHFTLLTHLLRSDGSKWHEVKKNNPQKHKSDCIILASSTAYPKVNIGIPGKTIYRINPMIEFDDTETYQLSRELKIPIVPDICMELHGEMFEQDRRHLSKCLEILSRIQNRLKLSENSLLYNYRNMVKFMTEIEILPPLEELDGITYDVYNFDFDDNTYELLKR